MPTGQETDENAIAIIDAAPQGTVPHPVFLDFYAKFDKYFGEENDSRMLDNFGLEYLLSKVLNLSNEDIQIVINHYNTTDQDSVEWFEQHDNELEKKEEWNIDGFDPTQDNQETVNLHRRVSQYLSKNKKLKTTTNLNEGRYDALTNQLSNIAFEVFKNVHDRGDKKDSFEFRVDHPDEEHDIPSKEFYFDFLGSVEITDDEYEVDGGANAGFDDKGDEITPMLSVKFKIPKNPDWQRISFDIKDVVRHELEH